MDRLARGGLQEDRGTRPTGRWRVGAVRIANNEYGGVHAVVGRDHRDQGIALIDCLGQRGTQV